MNPWWLVGLVFAVCGQLAVAAFLVLGSMARAAADRHEKELARLHEENRTLLATALNAQGVIRVDPGMPHKVAEVEHATSVMRKIAGGLVKLEREDAAKALDRDARVASEIDAANRAARAARGDA